MGRCAQHSEVGIISFLLTRALETFSSRALVRQWRVPSSRKHTAIPADWLEPPAVGDSWRNPGHSIDLTYFYLRRICHRTLKPTISLPIFFLSIVKTLLIISTVHLITEKFMALLACKSLEFCEFQH